MPSSTPAVAGALCVLLASVAFTAAEQRPRATIADVSWMAGTWVAASQAETVEERWTPPGGAAMLAVSRTVRGDRMAGFEFLRIIERDGGLVYVSQPNGQPPTDFPLTRLDGKSATFENPQHDFPKAIAYTLRSDGALEATISGGPGQRKTSWVFVRQ